MLVLVLGLKCIVEDLPSVPTVHRPVLWTPRVRRQLHRRRARCEIAALRKRNRHIVYILLAERHDSGVRPRRARSLGTHHLLLVARALLYNRVLGRADRPAVAFPRERAGPRGDGHRVRVAQAFDARVCGCRVLGLDWGQCDRFAARIEGRGPDDGCAAGGVGTGGEVVALR